MSASHVSGPFISANGFGSGTSTTPVSITTASNLSSYYATTSAASGDTRLNYSKLFFTSTGGGETLRAYSIVTGANAATADTINGAHISMLVDTGGTISGAGNAIRATLGSTVNSPGGTLAAIQLDTDFGSSVSLPASASYIRVTDSSAGTGKIANLFNIDTAPAAGLVVTTTGVTTSKAINILIGGTTYYIPIGTVKA